eukprot:g6181.t1
MPCSSRRSDPCKRSRRRHDIKKSGVKRARRDDDLSILTVVELKAQLKKHGLKRTGRKSELVARLVKAIRTEEAGVVPTPPCSAVRAGNCGDFENLDGKNKTHILATENTKAIMKLAKQEKRAALPQQGDVGGASPVRRTDKWINRNKKVAEMLQKLTPEQREIIKLGKPPMGLAPATSSVNDDCFPFEHRVVRVLAAAGSGKTTTILTLILKLVQLGHKHIVYCVYNRKNAAEAKEKLLLLGLDDVSITCKTIDALAREVVCPANTLMEPLSDADLMKFIKNRFNRKIELFLGDLSDYGGSPRRYNKYLKMCKDFVALVIFKTLQCFLQSDMLPSNCSEPTLESPRSPCRNCKTRLKLEKMRQAIPKWQHTTSPVKCNPCEDNFFQVLASNNPHFENDLYYPGKLWHTRDVEFQKNRRLKCPTYLPRLAEARAWYADRTKEVWELMSIGQLQTYDSISKLAQLQQKPIWRYSEILQSDNGPSIGTPTALCVDEAQDINPAKCDWLAQQARCMQVFFLGDAMQQIYYFSGSRSKNMMGLKDRLDRLLPDACRQQCLTCKTLTASFRFGQNIANAANVIILAKKHSRQKHCFQPYWINGVGGRTLENGDRDEGRVTEQNLLQMRDQHGKFQRVPEHLGGCLTVLCRKNVTIMELALDLLAADNTVKVAINGEGSNSGCQKFSRVCREIKHFYAVYARIKDTLPFKEWKNVTGLTWDQVLTDVVEIAQDYWPHIHVITKFGGDDLHDLDASSTCCPYEDSEVARIIAKFKMLVLDKRIPPDASTAEVIFSTIHVAKGLEWDVVQIANMETFPLFFCDRDAPSASSSHPASQTSFVHASHASSVKWSSPGFGFRTGKMEDEVNLHYVALTRAKRMLSVPSSTLFAKLVRTMERVKVARDHLQSDHEYDVKQDAHELELELCGSSVENNKSLRRSVLGAVVNCEAVCDKVLENDRTFSLPIVVGRRTDKSGETC